MATGQFGDLVVEMGVDDRKWIEGVLRIQNSAKGLANNVTSTMSGIGGGIGRGIGQAAFAAQDFASVLSQGGPGALSRALLSTMNNVQVLGSAFGPWGLAITAVGGALGSILIPRLLEGTDQTTAFTNSVKASTDAIKEQVKASNDAIDFRTKLTSVASGTSTGLDRTLREHDVATDKIKAERDIVERELSLSLMKANDLGAIRNLDPAGRGFLMDRNRVNPDARVSVSEDVLGKDGAKALKDLFDRWKELSRASSVFDTRRAELGALAPDVEDSERRRRNDEQLKKDEAAAERIREQSRSPLEIASDRIEEITRLTKEGHLTDPRAIDSAVNDVFMDFTRASRTRRIDQKIDGGELGTSAGFSDLLKSIRQSEGNRSQELDTLKSLKAPLDGILSAMRSGLKLSPPVKMEGI